MSKSLRRLRNVQSHRLMKNSLCVDEDEDEDLYLTTHVR
jgi:hypothetical protein